MMTRPVRISAWIAATLLTAGCDTGRSTPLQVYAPLPIIDASPAILDDSDATRDYVNTFPTSEYEQYEVPGAGRFFIDQTEDVIKRVIVRGDQWEPHTLKLCEQHVEPGSVVVEVGAHIGSHTVPISRLVGPWGRVYAFEPQRKMFRELHHNLALNGITNAIPLRFAIGSGDLRILEMNAPTPGNEGGTGIGSGGDPVELRTLDSFGFERVSLLKIDVEGFEDAVLDGAAETIRRNRPVILIEIMGGHSYDTAPPRHSRPDTGYPEETRRARLRNDASPQGRLYGPAPRS